MATWIRAVQVLGRRVGVRPVVQEGERVAARRLITKSASKDGGLGVGAVGVMHQGWSFSDRSGLDSLLMPSVSQRGLQRRGMFIQVESTPNPQSLMFYPGKPVMEVGSSDFPNARAAMASPLAKALFIVDGVVRVFFGADFVTVTKSEEMPWDVLKPEIFAAIMDFYSTKQPLFYDAKSQASDTAINEDDDETVAMIKELLETRIRPAVQDDGGDIEYRGFNPETGIVSLKMQGACSGCPSSAVTLKSGIENMLMHYVSEVKGVEEVHDGDTDDEGEVQTSEAG
jgi:Fe-S cluster biogenesis protein NfuA